MLLGVEYNCNSICICSTGSNKGRCSGSCSKPNFDVVKFWATFTSASQIRSTISPSFSTDLDHVSQMREGADFHVWTEMSQGRGRRLVDLCSSCSVRSSQQQAPPQAALRQASTSYLTHAETSFGSCKHIQPVAVNTIWLSQEFFLYSTPAFLKCLPQNRWTSSFLFTPVLKNRKPSHKQFIRNKRFFTWQPDHTY